MSKEELAQALAQQDWNNVLKHGAPLCNSRDRELYDASCLAVDTALFVLEHPEMNGASPDLAKIVLGQIPGQKKEA
jgi:hypothetical protein